jgi:hypothetical protein
MRERIVEPTCESEELFLHKISHALSSILQNKEFAHMHLLFIRYEQQFNKFPFGVRFRMDRTNMLHIRHIILVTILVGG